MISESSFWKKTTYIIPEKTIKHPTIIENIFLLFTNITILSILSVNI